MMCLPTQTIYQWLEDLGRTLSRNEMNILVSNPSFVLKIFCFSMKKCFVVNCGLLDVNHFMFTVFLTTYFYHWSRIVCSLMELVSDFNAHIGHMCLMLLRCASHNEYLHSEENKSLSCYLSLMHNINNFCLLCYRSRPQLFGVHGHVSDW